MNSKESFDRAVIRQIDGHYVAIHLTKHHVGKWDLVRIVIEDRPALTPRDYAYGSEELAIAAAQQLAREALRHY